MDAICSLVSMSLAMPSSCSDTASTAASMPRLRPIGLAPAATLRRPSRTMAWASTVAVVVPSPATSSVFLATSLTSSAPIFSYGSSSSISLAMLTPSLVMVGAPHFFSRTTLRPLGPSVTLTASASVFMPRSRPRRASSLKAISFGITPAIPHARAGWPVRWAARDGRSCSSRRTLPAGASEPQLTPLRCCHSHGKSARFMFSTRVLRVQTSSRARGTSARRSECRSSKPRDRACEDGEPACRDPVGSESWARVRPLARSRRRSLALAARPPAVRRSLALPARPPGVRRSLALAARPSAVRRSLALAARPPAVRRTTTARAAGRWLRISDGGTVRP